MYILQKIDRVIYYRIMEYERGEYINKIRTFVESLEISEGHPDFEVVQGLSQMLSGASNIQEAPPHEIIPLFDPDNEGLSSNHPLRVAMEDYLSLARITPETRRNCIFEGEKITEGSYPRGHQSVHPDEMPIGCLIPKEAGSSLPYKLWDILLRNNLLTAERLAELQDVDFDYMRDIGPVRVRLLKQLREVARQYLIYKKKPEEATTLIGRFAQGMKHRISP